MASVKDRIIKKLRSYNHVWEWLSYDCGHIRVHDFGDIWLTKGTYKLENSNDYNKSDIHNLLTLLSKKIPEEKEPSLEQRIISLEELVMNLQEEIRHIKNR